MLIKKWMSMVDRTKKDLNMSRWLHMPPASFEYRYCKCLCGYYKAAGYEYLGAVMSFDIAEASYTRSITYIQKAKAICNLLGLEDKAKLIYIHIATYKDCLPRCDGDCVNVAVNASTLSKGASMSIT